MYHVGDVNGVNTRPVFSYLKKATGKKIEWNFDGKFIVDRQGGVHTVSDKDLGTVEATIKDLLSKM
jgi:glutathione peroxidase-family protein